MCPLMLVAVRALMSSINIPEPPWSLNAPDAKTSGERTRLLMTLLVREYVRIDPVRPPRDEDPNERVGEVTIVNVSKNSGSILTRGIQVHLSTNRSFPALSRAGTRLQSLVYRFESEELTQWSAWPNSPASRGDSWLQ